MFPRYESRPPDASGGTPVGNAAASTSVREKRQRIPAAAAALFVAALAALAAAGSAGSASAPADPAGAATDGLVAAPAPGLDLFRVRPDLDLSGYRSVIVDPARAALRRNWLKDINDSRSPARWLSSDDAAEITDEAAASLRTATETAFRERGYAIAAVPGEGVLRLSPGITDLDVYAPDVPTPGMQRYYERDAGQATLHLEARDAVTGTLVARITDSGTASEVRLNNRATSVSNRFWFDALFRQWATRCAGALGTAPPRKAPPR